jgi:hypothetical protein
MCTNVGEERTRSFEAFEADLQIRRMTDVTVMDAIDVAEAEGSFAPRICIVVLTLL